MATLNSTTLRSPGNVTGAPPSVHELQVEDYARLISTVVMMVMIIIGNLLVMAAYKQNTRLQTATYKLLVSLAVCDFLVGSVSVPFWIYVSFSQWDTQDKILDSFFVCFDFVTALSSALHLTVIAMERWLAISRPFHHQTLSHQQYVLALLFVWLIALVVGGCYFIGPFFNIGHIYVPTMFCVGFLIPFSVICLVNISIFRIAQKLIHAVPATSFQPNAVSNDQKTKIQKERKTAITLVIITGLFFFALLPTYVIALLGEFSLSFRRLPWIDLTRLFDFAKWLQYSNSAVNPCVYTFRDAEMRKTFKRLAKRALFFKSRAAIEQQSTSMQNMSGGLS